MLFDVGAIVTMITISFQVDNLLLTETTIKKVCVYVLRLLSNLKSKLLSTYKTSNTNLKYTQCRVLPIFLAIIY